MHSPADQTLNDLIARHVDFVYSVARRAVGDAHLAEDVTQAVFVVFARKARSIPSKAVASFLFTTTRYAAKNALKTAARRAHHERAAAKSEVQMSEPPESVDPLLNDAMARLSEADRRAILLRYYEGKQISEITAAVGGSEAAVRK